jgi:hypothetical protein
MIHTEGYPCGTPQNNIKDGGAIGITLNYNLSRVYEVSIGTNHNHHRNGFPFSIMDLIQGKIEL